MSIKIYSTAVIGLVLHSTSIHSAWIQVEAGDVDYVKLFWQAYIVTVAYYSANFHDIYTNSFNFSSVHFDSTGVSFQLKMSRLAGRKSVKSAVMLNEAKTSRPRPELRGRGRGWGRGQDYEVEAEAEAKNNYEKIANND